MPPDRGENVSMTTHDINRRQFMRAAVGGAAGLPLISQAVSHAADAGEVPAAVSVPDSAVTGNSDTQGMTRQPPHPMAVDHAARVVLESPRRTPVVADIDVLVAGGGPAGVAAALAAAREGARTLLIERHGMVGGTWTAGLLNPFFEFHRKGWIVAELVDELQKAKVWLSFKSMWTFDTEFMKLLLERLLEQAGAETWYYSFAADTIVEHDRVRGVIVEGKSGRQAVLAKVVVDCTGDGDIAARAGVPYQLGRPSDSACQPMTLMFEIEGIGDYVQPDPETLYDQMQQAIERGGLPVKLPIGRVNYAPWIINLPRSGAAAVQATHVYRMNPLDTRDLTAATRQARRQAHELTLVIRHIPGLEHVRLTQTAPAIGIRESRHLAGRHTLDLDDLRAGRTFEDAVTFGAFGVDIHDVNPGESKKSAHSTPIRPYEIPYRCLLPQRLSGLLFAGRCISGTHEAHASFRVTGTCMAMGQAAGLAAAISAAENRSPEQLDGKSLNKALRTRGVQFISD
jgi:hypothetical protein